VSLVRRSGGHTVGNSHEVLVRLAANPTVIGVVRYGDRPVDATEAGGDLDLFVLVDHRPPQVESLHFFIGDLPVDLNVRTWADLEADELLTPVDQALFHGQILHDRDGDLAARLGRYAEAHDGPLLPLSEHDVALIRFGQRHGLDKVRGRFATDPILCRLLLESNVYWLIQHYFRIRRLHFPGEKAALRHLEQREAAIWPAVQRFYDTTELGEKLAIAEELNRRILAPLGGPWRPDEVLTLAAEHMAIDLQDVGRRYLAGLVAPDAASAPSAPKKG
jgi:hypothetical protein